MVGNGGGILAELTVVSARFGTETQPQIYADLKTGSDAKGDIDRRGDCVRVPAGARGGDVVYGGLVIGKTRILSSGRDQKALQPGNHRGLRGNNPLACG